LWDISFLPAVAEELVKRLEDGRFAGSPGKVSRAATVTMFWVE